MSTAQMIDMANEDDRRFLIDRFHDCPYHDVCARAINEGCYPAYFCQCHHGRSLLDADFRHEFMRGYMQERFP